MTEPAIIPRDKLLLIKKKIDSNRDCDMIAMENNVPVELVKQIADGTIYKWLFQGGVND